MRILDPRPTWRRSRLTHAAGARACCPSSTKTPITAAWAGYIDSTPDGVPAIGEIATCPASSWRPGFSGHGFGIGPGAGHLIADLVTGAEPIVDPGAYARNVSTASAWGKVAEF